MEIKLRNTGFCILMVFMALLIVVSTPHLSQAQTRGRIVGRVIDSSTGVSLVGANVMLRGTNLGAATDRFGNFRIDNVSFGTYTLVVTYIGYERDEKEVTVSVSEPIVSQNLMPESSHIEMDAVTVYGMRQGVIKALSQQRVSPNIKNVISEEQMQRFPDLNTTEVLQRIPGVTITRDQGEGRYVLIRGTEARLNNVTINGQMVASPEDAERYVGLDVIGANQVSSIEVTKAITPDMDAEAIGGSVNLVTKSAFDRDERILNVTLGGGYSRLLGKPLYQGKFSFSDRFGENKNWGLTISGNYYRSERGNHNNEMEWGSEKDIDGNEIPWALGDLDLRYYKVKRTRYGVSGDLEYRPSNGHRFFVRGMYNLRDDYENRFRLRIRPNKGDYVDATHIEGAAMVRALKDRLEKQVINYIGGGGMHNFGNVTLDYNVSYSWAKEEKPQQVDPEFELDEDADLTLDLSNPDLPKYTITNLAKDYEHDPDHWKLEGFGMNKNFNHDKEITGLFNLKYPFLVGDNTAELKIGGKARIKKKDRDDNEWTYSWEGDEDILLSQFVTGDEEEDYLDGAYRMGPEVDMDKSRAFFERHRGGLLEEEVDQEATLGNTFVAKENIFAYYAMTTVNFGPLMVLGGFRHELTSTDYTGKELIYDDEGEFESVKDLKDSKSFHNFMPMIHLRYRVGPMTQFRVAVTSGVSRPNYFDMVPYLFVFHEDEELRRGNPELKPTTAYNFDLMGEHYFQGIGIFSGGFFYKSLKNIIYDRIYREQSGAYARYETEQATNGGSSWLWGVEVNWSQQFTFLPGFLSGFGIYANYTYTKSEADIPGRERTILPGQSGNVANLALSYEKGGFTSRFGMNYHGKFIEDVGEDEEHDRYYHDHLQLDFSGSMRLFSGLSLFVEVVNINNEPLKYYMGRPERPVQREFYKWWSHVGIKYEL